MPGRAGGALMPRSALTRDHAALRATAGQLTRAPGTCY